MITTRYATLSSGVPCYRKYSGQHNLCEKRAMHHGKARCNTVECTTVFLYFDCLYFLWHGVKINKMSKAQQSYGGLQDWIAFFNLLDQFRAEASFWRHFDRGEGFTDRRGWRTARNGCDLFSCLTTRNGNENGCNFIEINNLQIWQIYLIKYAIV